MHTQLWKNSPKGVQKLITDDLQYCIYHICISINQSVNFMFTFLRFPDVNESYYTMNYKMKYLSHSSKWCSINTVTDVLTHVSNSRLWLS